jgi:hypothetical protein
MCGHGWWAGPAGGLADETDALTGEVVALRVVPVFAADDPLVDASAIPALPAPTPAAITAVMMSRRNRPADPGLVVRTVGCPFFVTQRARRKPG